MPREIPRAGAAHRDAGQIDAVPVAAKLLDGLIERGERLLLHLPVPLMPEAALRQHHDGASSRRIAREQRGESDGELAKVIVAALAASVQKEDDRPAMELRVMPRKPDAIRVRRLVNGDSTLDESRSGRTSRECTLQNAKCEDQTSRAFCILHSAFCIRRVSAALTRRDRIRRPAAPARQSCASSRRRAGRAARGRPRGSSSNASRGRRRGRASTL